MNYEAERAMNQKRLRMDEPGHGVIQGNGLPLNYMDNGHQIPYQPYAGAYNTHYPPPDAFAAYGPPPPGGYAPQNLSYAPPAHQNYPHHQSFPPQQPQAQLHMPQTHMVQGYGDVGMHKGGWPQHLLPPLDTQKPDVKQPKPEIKLEPADTQKRPHPENEMMGGELDQPKIKIKTDIFKPDDPQHRLATDKPQEAQIQKPVEVMQPADQLNKEIAQPVGEVKIGEPAAEARHEPAGPDAARPDAAAEKKAEEVKREALGSPGGAPRPALPSMEPKKRGRPKGSTNKPKPVIPGGVSPRGPAPSPRGPAPSPRLPTPRPRHTYQYAARPFRKDFSGIQFRRRWSDDCLDSSHIPNEVYFGDVPVPLEVLHNYHDAHAERERLAQQAATIAAHKAAAAKLAAARLPRPLHPLPADPARVTTVDSSSDDSSGSSGSDSEDSDDDAPLKRGPGRPKGSKSTPKKPGAGTPGAPGSGRRGRPPVPPELREPGIMEVKKFCKAAGIRFDYKKLVEGCTKNKERVGKMLELLVAAGLEGKPTLEKCQQLKRDKLDKRAASRKEKEERKEKAAADEEDEESGTARRMTRGATGVKPRQKIVISSDEEEDTPAARRTLSRLRQQADDEDDDD